MSALLPGQPLRDDVVAETRGLAAAQGRRCCWAVPACGRFAPPVRSRRRACPQAELTGAPGRTLPCLKDGQEACGRGLVKASWPATLQDQLTPKWHWIMAGSQVSPPR